MPTVEDVARTVEGAGDLEEAIAQLTAAGLGVSDSGNHVLVSGSIAVAHVGGTATNNAYWIVYDVHNPSKRKMKVPGKAPNDVPAEAPDQSGSR